MTGCSLGWRRGYGLLIGGTLLSVALADFLFYDHVVGWTAGLFAAALLALLVIRGGRFFTHLPGRVLFAAAAGLVVALVEEPGPLPVLMTCLCIAMLAILNRAEWTTSVAAWARRLVHLLTRGLLRLFLDNRVALRWLARQPVSTAGPLRGAAAWGLPALLGLAFVGLFTLANPVISRWVGHAAEQIANVGSFLARCVDVPRNAFWVVTAMTVYALLRVRRGRRVRHAPLPDAAAPHVSFDADPFNADPWDAARLARRAAFESGVVLRCLVVFNALFLLQNGLDVVYLFGGAALPDGMSYATYARRGAYPLVATALLAAAFVLVAFRPGAAAARSAPARRLVYLWVAQNVFLTVTAAWRLDLYVAAYGLTRLRLAAGVWMVLVAAGLAWIGCRIVLRRDNAWLLHANLLTAGVVLYACCFMNVGGTVADFNARHCREAGGEGAPLDLAYLRHLGPEALPALRRVMPLLADPRRAELATAHAQELDTELAEKLSDWHGWTMRRSRLRR